jgi:hypothetical protein
MGMRKRTNIKRQGRTGPSLCGEEFSLAVLPQLSTATQIARPLKVTSRLVHIWATSGKIPVALRQGKIVRFSPAEVAKALGIAIPELGHAPPEGTEAQ